MTKTSRARYSLECNQEAARLVEGGQSIATSARTVGRPLLPAELLEKWTFDRRENVLNARQRRTLAGASTPSCPLALWERAGVRAPRKPPKAQNWVMLPKRQFLRKIGLHRPIYGR